MSWIDYQAVPPVGSEVMLDDQVYRIEHTEPHRRLDGRMTTLLTWRTLCPRCGQSFTVKTGLVCKAVNRRCSACKRTGSPISRKRGKAVAVTARGPKSSTKGGFRDDLL